MRASLPREIAALLLLVATGLVLLALATYHPSDPSWSVAATGQIENAAGPVGAYLADLLLRFFGLGAYFLVAGAALEGLAHLHGGWGPWRGLARWLGLGLAFLAVLGLLALVPLPEPPWLDATGSGGIAGHLIARALVPYLHPAGTGLALTGALLAGLIVATGRSWLALLELLGRAVVLGLRWFGGHLRVLGSRLASGFSLPPLPRLPRLRPLSRGKAGSRTKTPPLPEQNGIAEFRPDPETEAPEAPVEASPRPPGNSGRSRTKAEKSKAKKPGRAESPADSSLPPLELLDRGERKAGSRAEEGLEKQARLVESRLADFGVTAQVVEHHSGPVVTRFELEPAPGTKVSKVSNLAKDLARSLSVHSVRVVENVPGKPVIGLEVPRARREAVRLRELLGSPAFQEADSPVTLALGADISGEPVVTDLTSLPHFLIAGTTGAGKSVGINAMLLSLLYKAPPDQVRLILVDPKMLELSVYDGIPHLLAPVVTDMGDAANAFKWCLAEMDRRFQLMAHLGVRSLAGYNRQVRAAREAGQPLVGPSPDGIHDGPELEAEPWLVVVVDELADLMMVAGKQVEESITRLAQKARAAGIHLILATQRPSVDVLTGLIKANIPARIAFQVNQRVDSRTILDQGGAEQLLGRGDMLFYPASYSTPRRVHGALVEDHEVERVVSHLKAVGAPEYNQEVLAERDEAGTVPEEEGEGSAESDPLYDQAVRIVTESRRASISNVQRRLRVGYNRAARLIDAMEAAGVVGPQQANGSREVLASPPAEG